MSFLAPQATGAIMRKTGLAVVVMVSLLGAPLARAQERQPVDRSRDRGEGLPTDMFGTYIRGGELLVYPFFEYYRDRNYEYSAADLGFVGETDFRGRYRASESFIFLAYGISNRVAVEFEAATIRATLLKASEDTSVVPARLHESGLGDVATRVRWRWNRESDSRPEFFSSVEAGFPLQRSRRLIGTQDWELKFLTGAVRGYSWGTITLRASLDNIAGTFEPGEYGFDYLIRISERFRVYGGIEGTQDEVELITEGRSS